MYLINVFVSYKFVHFCGGGGVAFLETTVVHGENVRTFVLKLKKKPGCCGTLRLSFLKTITGPSFIPS